MTQHEYFCLDHKTISVNLSNFRVYLRPKKVLNVALKTDHLSDSLLCVKPLDWTTTIRYEPSNLPNQTIQDD